MLKIKPSIVKLLSLFCVCLTSHCNNPAESNFSKNEEPSILKSETPEPEISAVPEKDPYALAECCESECCESACGEAKHETETGNETEKKNKARKNFSRSLAAYSLLTYIL